MYSSDRMKTLIILCKDYDKNIVFRDSQMHCFYIHLRRKEIFFSFVNLLSFLPKINRYWTTFETLSEIERDCKELQLCMGDCIFISSFMK